MVSEGFELPPALHSPLTALQINSGTDPFITTAPVLPRVTVKAKWIERNVLDYYASLWNAKWPHDPNDPETYWGYVLTMGSTEGNMHALWSARNYLSGKCESVKAAPDKKHDAPVQMRLASGTTSLEPVVICSENCNFSFVRLCDIVNVPMFHVVGREQYPNESPLGGVWSQGVPCTGGDAGPGTVDIDALEKVVDFFSSKGHPIIVVFNYGTTFKGGCDDVQTAGERLVRVLKKNNMYERTLVDPDNPSSLVVRRGFWFHVDGALAAAYMPFLEMAYKNGLTDIKPASTFDFRLDFISSIVMSGHKYIGTPWPCGVYLVKETSYSFQGRPSTITVSRNGHSSLLLWTHISSHSYEDQISSLLGCFHVLEYALGRFEELQKKLGMDLCVMNTAPSLSIIFRWPKRKSILTKYAFMLIELCIDSEKRPLVEMFAMQHVTTDLIDALIEDLQAPGVF
jgi:histidine decarboxylase